MPCTVSTQGKFSFMYNAKDHTVPAKQGQLLRFVPAPSNVREKGAAGEIFPQMVLTGPKSGFSDSTMRSEHFNSNEGEFKSPAEVEMKALTEATLFENLWKIMEPMASAGEFDKLWRTFAQLCDHFSARQIPGLARNGANTKVLFREALRVMAKAVKQADYKYTVTRKIMVLKPATHGKLLHVSVY